MHQPPEIFEREREPPGGATAVDEDPPPAVQTAVHPRRQCGDARRLPQHRLEAGTVDLLEQLKRARKIVPGEIGQVAGEGMTAFGRQVAELVVAGLPQEASGPFPGIVDVALCLRHKQNYRARKVEPRSCTPARPSKGRNDSFLIRST